MIGYWLVIALVACAIAAVLVAAAGMRDAPPTTARRPPVLVALGASDALGEGAPSPQEDNWVARLAAELTPDVDVRNLAVGGSTLATVRRDRLSIAVSARPDVVVCWLAVNDLITGVALNAYERDLDALLSALAHSGSVTVLGNVPDLGRLPFLAHNPEEADEARRAAIRWNAAIARIAAAHGVQLVNLFDESLAPADFGPDGFHPSPAGHVKLAARFLPPVRRALAAE